MARLFTLSLTCIAAIGLSACGTFLDQKQPDVDVRMRSDDGSVMTPMAPALRSENESGASYSSDSVTINDFNAYPEIPRPTYQNNTGMGYAGGTVPTADSSVTIFALDGDVAPMAQEYAQGYDGGYGYDAPMNQMSGYNSSYGGGEGQIFFKNGSSRLGSGDMNKLSRVAEQARFAPVNRITVEGYASRPTQAGTQTVEAHILNLKESMNRSFAVSKTLMQKGVPAEKLKTVSWGSTKASGNDTQDRRVDVVMGER